MLPKSLILPFLPSLQNQIFSWTQLQLTISGLTKVSNVILLPLTKSKLVISGLNELSSTRGILEALATVRSTQGNPPPTSGSRI
ncbi:unnamed protein product [Hymenolepis diminuta]|uniref:Uncharacterized protein n=1 Tax=Hymenolepis diminuta TaxID=6216 RepID=A0A564YAM6_HYMDI|nr:unnamed protein product [Hymenolepis diminuta]